MRLEQFPFDLWLPLPCQFTHRARFPPIQSKTPCCHLHITSASCKITFPAPFYHVLLCNSLQNPVVYCICICSSVLKHHIPVFISPNLWYRRNTWYQGFDLCCQWCWLNALTTRFSQKVGVFTVLGDEEKLLKKALSGWLTWIITCNNHFQPFPSGHEVQAALAGYQSRSCHINTLL